MCYKARVNPRRLTKMSPDGRPGLFTATAGSLGRRGVKQKGCPFLSNRRESAGTCPSSTNRAPGGEDPTSGKTEETDCRPPKKGGNWKKENGPRKKKILSLELNQRGPKRLNWGRRDRKRSQKKKKKKNQGKSFEDGN